MNIDTVTRLFEVFGDFLDFLAKATPPVLALSGFLAYYYREKLKSVLGRSVALDIESYKSELAKQMAEYTTTLQRDLEAYKVGLIAEAERIKASQDIRKSIALKVAEKKLQTIMTLADAHLGIDTEIGTLVCSLQSAEATELERYSAKRNALFDRLDKYATASDEALLFISPELRSKVLEVRQAALSVIAMRPDCSAPPLAKEDPKITKLFDKSVELEGQLRLLLSELEQA